MLAGPGEEWSRDNGDGRAGPRRVVGERPDPPGEVGERSLAYDVARAMEMDGGPFDELSVKGGPEGDLKSGFDPARSPEDGKASELVIEDDRLRCPCPIDNYRAAELTP